MRPHSRSGAGSTQESPHPATISHAPDQSSRHVIRPTPRGLTGEINSYHHQPINPLHESQNSMNIGTPLSQNSTLQFASEFSQRRSASKSTNFAPKFYKQGESNPARTNPLYLHRLTSTPSETHRSKIPKSAPRRLPHRHIDPHRSPSRPTADILLKGGTIIDGTGGKPYEGSVADPRRPHRRRRRRSPTPPSRQNHRLQRPRHLPRLHRSAQPQRLDDSQDSGRSAAATSRKAAPRSSPATAAAAASTSASTTTTSTPTAPAPTSSTSSRKAPSARRSWATTTARRPPRNSRRCRTSSTPACSDGAWGMSTGLHYIPGTFAKTDELIALAKVVGQARRLLRQPHPRRRRRRCSNPSKR